MSRQLRKKKVSKKLPKRKMKGLLRSNRKVKTQSNKSPQGKLSKSKRAVVLMRVKRNRRKKWMRKQSPSRGRLKKKREEGKRGYRKRKMPCAHHSKTL